VAQSGTQICPSSEPALEARIKPIRAAFNPLAYENGLIYAAETVAIDLENTEEPALRVRLVPRARVYIGYVTKTRRGDNAKAYREAMALAVEVGEITSESARRSSEAEAEQAPSWQGKEKATSRAARRWLYQTS